jgi:site-specific DNA-adenine methylase
MWSYVGRKWKIVDRYPKPIYDKIIEPFAGTASYSYRYWERDVVITDTYDKIYRIWKYLQQATKEDILSLPDIKEGETLRRGYEYLSDEERWLVGFSINQGSSVPKLTSGKMGFNSWYRDKVRIANDLYKIKHWTILNKSYSELENERATWFVDPPYQFKKWYRDNNIDYQSLAGWCKGRIGQVIVCENSYASWLDFEPLVELQGQRTKTLEVMWYKE